MPRLKHIHKYGKSHLGYKKTTVVFRCFAPGCGHFLYPAAVVNRFSRCWKCDGEMLMTPKVIKEKPGKPLCNRCWKKLDINKSAVLDNMLEELGLPIKTEDLIEAGKEEKEKLSLEQKAFNSLMRVPGMTEEKARQILGQHKPASDRIIEELIAADDDDEDGESVH